MSNFGDGVSVEVINGLDSSGQVPMDCNEEEDTGMTVACEKCQRKLTMDLFCVFTSNFVCSRCCDHSKCEVCGDCCATFKKERRFCTFYCQSIYNNNNYSGCCITGVEPKFTQVN